MYLVAFSFPAFFGPCPNFFEMCCFHQRWASIFHEIVKCLNFNIFCFLGSILFLKCLRLVNFYVLFIDSYMKCVCVFYIWHSTVESSPWIQKLNSSFWFSFYILKIQSIKLLITLHPYLYLFSLHLIVDISECGLVSKGKG